MEIRKQLEERIYEMEKVAQFFNVEPFDIYFLGGSGCITRRDMMYRIVCESYKNFIKDFPNKDDDLYKLMLPFELCVDLNKYNREKKMETQKYKKLEDFVYYIKKDIENYKNFQSFIWTLESRGIKGSYFGELTEEEFKEQTKILNMFLKLSYWD